MKKLFAIFTVLSFVATTVGAQIRTPQPSPSCELKQTVGLTEVTVAYSRPSAKDRTIFAADGVVPFGKVWRAGANSATKITFGDDVKVGGAELKKGSYALLITPNATEWKFMFYPYESTNWGSYVDKTPVATASATPVKLGNKVETLTYDINNLRNASASLDIMWDMTKAGVTIDVEVDKRVMADIDRVMAGPGAGDYYAAATYYHDSGKDLNKALEWIQKATAGDSPAFWQVRREALILGDLGRYDEAIAAAEKSKMLAEKAGNEEYVIMNKKSIEDWAKMKKSGKKN